MPISNNIATQLHLAIMTLNIDFLLMVIKWLYNDLKNGTPHFEYAKSVVKFRWILYEKYDFQKFCVNVFWEIQILSLEL